MSSRSAATITPARRLRGRLRVPGDKSISHRYAILAALAQGPSTLFNFAPGDDCRSTLAVLTALGVEVGERQEGSRPAITILGRGPGRLRSPARPLNAGNSGTTMRLMAGVLAGHPFTSRLVGDESLSRRPMRRVIAPLERMGARIEAADGHAPLDIHGTQLHAIAHVSALPSAQVKSAVLLAGLLADGVTRVTEPSRTRDHTERALRAFGGQAMVDGLTVSVTAGQPLEGRSLTIPGDASSAAFWLVAAAGLPGSRIEITDVGLNPTRTAFLAALERVGAKVTVEAADADDVGTEPRGTVAVEHSAVGPLTIAPDEVPGLIDELPALASLAAYGAEVRVSGAGELRVKESDRIATLVAGFRALGLDADERPDGFIVAAGAGGRAAARPSGGVVDACGDHRLAMAFALVAAGAGGPSTIRGADAVSISYPEFFETLVRLAAAPVELDT